MQRIEMVQVRLFDVGDRESVIDAFNRIFLESPQTRIELYHSTTIANDWSICFWESNADGQLLNLPEVICLADSLRQLGFVNHASWVRVPVTPNSDRDSKRNPLDR
ncbi:MAG: hypothetical protein MUC33_12145 [Desulfobacterales bacterium]|nr:hypothetical protein [Desulfobacterales bacterium]